MAPEGKEWFVSYVLTICCIVFNAYFFHCLSFVVFSVPSVLGVTWLTSWWQKGLNSQFVTRAFTTGLSASSGHMPLYLVKHQNWVSQGLFMSCCIVCMYSVMCVLSVSKWKPSSNVLSWVWCHNVVPKLEPFRYVWFSRDLTLSDVQ